MMESKQDDGCKAEGKRRDEDDDDDWGEDAPKGSACPKGPPRAPARLEAKAELTSADMICPTEPEEVPRIDPVRVTNLWIHRPEVGPQPRVVEELLANQPERVSLFDFILFRELSLKVIDHLNRPRDPL